MTSEKRVLMVGLNPELIDCSQPGKLPGMSRAKVSAGLTVDGRGLVFVSRYGRPD